MEKYFNKYMYKNEHLENLLISARMRQFFILSDDTAAAATLSLSLEPSIYKMLVTLNKYL